MKKIFVFIFSMALLQAYAQTEVEKNLKKEIWTNAPQQFKATQVPEKWKAESAVILALQRDYVCDMATKVTKRFYVQKVYVHIRIKLLDKAAVEDFSELAFDNKTIKTNIFGRSSTYSIMAAKIIKPNATEKEVDFSSAVKTDLGSRKDLKMPIPNLEPGDILDYYVASKDENLEMPNFSDEDILEKKYPLVAGTYRYSIPHEMNFKSFSFNGAPDFKKTVIKNDVIYELRDEMRAKRPELLWDFEYRTSPHVRYKISSGSSSNMKTEAENILSKFKYNLTDIGFIADYMNGNFKKEKDVKKIAYEVGHLLNNPIYKKAYFEIEQGNPLSAGYPGDLYFALLNKYFMKKKIAHEVLIVPSREYGPFEDLVNLGSCDLMIRVNTTPPIYIQRPNPFTIPGDISSGFEGMEIVSEPFSSSATGAKVIPVTTAADNLTATKLTLILDETDNSKIKFEREVIAKGRSKINHQYLVFTNYDYLKEYDLPKYQVQSSHRLKDLIKDYNKEKNKFEQRQVSDYNERDQQIKRYLEKEMSVKLVDYKNLKIKNIGMWYDKPDTEYSDEFTVENMVKKVGPNMIVDLGKVIEGQTEIEENQKQRSRDIYMSNARSFTYDISFTIPQGYSVEGIENLNKKVEGEYGGFVSSARVEGNTLKVKTKKAYTKNYYPAADWTKITAFLTAAVDFYNAKILLKKIN